MKTFRIHYTVNSHPYQFDMRGTDASDIRLRFPKFATRIHGKAASVNVRKVKLLRTSHA